MHFNIQDILALSLVAVAAVYLVRRSWCALSSKSKGGCGACGSCGTGKEESLGGKRPLIQIEK